jgi:hypothetical protein
MTATPRDLTRPPEPAASDPAPPLLPVVLGFILAGALLLVLGLWRGGTSGAPGTSTIPALAIVEPTANAVLEQPLVVVFETDRLALTPSGWLSGDLHLHAHVHGVELMPGAADVEHLGGRRYRWTIRHLPAGAHQIRLLWAGPDHRRIPEGRSAVVPFHLR